MLCNGVSMFPVFAGMNRYNKPYIQINYSVPRARGDAPLNVSNKIMSDQCSPAHAGMNPYRWDR